MKKILVTYRLLPEAFVPYQQKYDLIFPTKGSFSENEIIKLIPECDALLSMFNMPINKRIIQEGKNLIQEHQDEGLEKTEKYCCYQYS